MELVARGIPGPTGIHGIHQITHSAQRLHLLLPHIQIAKHDNSLRLNPLHNSPKLPCTNLRPTLVRRKMRRHETNIDVRHANFSSHTGNPCPQIHALHKQTSFRIQVHVTSVRQSRPHQTQTLWHRAKPGLLWALLQGKHVRLPTRELTSNTSELVQRHPRIRSAR